MKGLTLPAGTDQKPIGIIVPTLTYQIEQEIIAGVRAFFEPYGVSVLVIVTDYLGSNGFLSSKQQYLLALTNRLELSGLILYGGGLVFRSTSELYATYLAQLSPIPTVSIGIDMPGYPVVLMDNYSSMRTLLRQIFTAHRPATVLYVTGPATNADSSERLRAYTESVQSLTWPIVDLPKIDGDFTRQGGMDALTAYLDAGGVVPQLIVCSNDLSALGILDVLHRRAISVPEQVRVTGFDDVEYAKVHVPALTTIEFPAVELGRCAAHTLHRLIAQMPVPERQIIAGQVRARASCPVPGADDSETAGALLRTYQQNTEFKIRLLRRSKFDYSFFNMANPADILRQGKANLSQAGVAAVYLYDRLAPGDRLGLSVFRVGLDDDLLIEAADAAAPATDALPRVLLNGAGKLSADFGWMLMPLFNEQEVFGHCFVQVHNQVPEFAEHLSLQFSGLLSRLQLQEQAREYQRQVMLSERMASLGHLVGGVAHELNTPLSIAKLMVEQADVTTRAMLALLAEASLSSSQMRERAEVIAQANRLSISNIEKAIELVNSFKAVAVDRSIGDRRTFILGDYLLDCIRTYRHLVKTEEIQLIVVCGEPIEMNSFPGQLSQVVANLLENAIYHGFAARSELQERVIQLRCLHHRRAGWVELEVSDNGAGIAEADIDRIFEPFFTTRRQDGGSGLGLSIVYNLVTQKLAGQIRVKTSPAGTCFTLELPMRVPDATAWPVAPD